MNSVYQPKLKNSTIISKGDNSVCVRCVEPFEPGENMVTFRDQLFHETCFICSQCFRPLNYSEFFEFEGRSYCKYDFQVLFAPSCNKCGEFIMSKVIKALDRSWHPECLICNQCGTNLATEGLQKYQSKPYCRDCFNELSKRHVGQHVCNTCQGFIEPGEELRFKGYLHHPYHFNCQRCESELGPDARERNGDLFCLRCFDKMGAVICAACRRPVEERIIWALGKSWHVEHFVCHHCEKPFMGCRFYEWRGHAYCLLDYQARAGNSCDICNRPVTGVLVRFTNKSYCPEHFFCSLCDKLMDEKSKFYEIDLKPVCKGCYEKLPTEWKKRLAKLHLAEAKK